MAYATSQDTIDYQPMHVNFGIMEPLPTRVRNKSARYEAYAARGREALFGYVAALNELGLLCETARERRDSAKQMCAAGCEPASAVACVVASAMETSDK
jgi:methylenetetrahydrofolate--tRNA-(uracil-5-)-methyltransferase